MKHFGAMVLLVVLAACSREEPNTGDAAGTADTDERAPNSVTNPSTAPAIDAAPTEVAVQRAKEDATEIAQDAEQGAIGGNEESPPPPADAPKTMK
jgi:hypothetical protein